MITNCYVRNNVIILSYDGISLCVSVSIGHSKMSAIVTNVIVSSIIIIVVIINRMEALLTLE